MFPMDGRNRITDYFLQRKRRSRRNPYVGIVIALSFTLVFVCLVTSWRSEPQEPPARKKSSPTNWVGSTWIILDGDDGYTPKEFITFNNSKHTCLIVIQRDGSTRCSPKKVCQDIPRALPKTEILLSPLATKVSMATKSKMAAVLLALSQDAAWVYVGKGSTLSVSKMESVQHPGRSIGLVYDVPGYFHPIHHHYGLQWMTDGYDATITVRAGRYDLRIVHSQGVYMFIDDCITQKLCLHSNPPIYVDSGIMTSLSSTSMLAHRDNAWLLLHSILRHSGYGTSSVIDLMLQRLLWETNYNLAFVPSAPKTEMNQSSLRCVKGDKSCNFGSDSTRQKDTNKNNDRCSDNFVESENTKVFQKQIKNIVCPRDLPFYQCAQKLISSFRNNISKSDDVTLNILSDWLKTLASIGYGFPARIPFPKEEGITQDIPIWFTPSPCKPIQRFLSYNNSDVKKQREQNVTVTWKKLFRQNLCPNHVGEVEGLIPKTFQIPDILLIIVFNYSYLASHVPVLLAMYGRHFRHILFCGEQFPSFTKFYKMENGPQVSFAEVNHAEGTWGYGCMSTAIKMGYDVTGYLQLSDDVLLNPWNLQDVPRDRFWYQSRVRVADIRLARLPDIATTNRWYPWIFSVGRPASTQALDLLKKMGNDITFGPKIRPYLRRLEKTTQCSFCLLYEASDIFYVPKHSRHLWSLFADVFIAYGTHLEIAIPSAIFGLAPEAEVYRMRGNYIWGDDRADFQKYYSHYDHFQHAFKLSRLAQAEGATFFCQDYLPWLEKDLIRHEGKVASAGDNSHSGNL